MTVLKYISDGIQGLSIKWKTLIPFLLFSFAGITIILVFSLRSQQNLILNEEKSLMLEYLKDFQKQADWMAEQSIAVSLSIAEYPEVGNLLGARDWQSLLKLLKPVYASLNKESGIYRLNIYMPPASLFLKLPRPDDPEEVSSNAKMISDALAGGKSASFFEKIDDNLCVMGLLPVYHDNVMEGGVVSGISLNRAFLDSYSSNKRMNASLYYIEAPGVYRLAASVGKKPSSSIKDLLPGNVDLSSPRILSHPENFAARSIIIGPIKDRSGNISALVEFDVDRSEIIDRLSEDRRLLMLIGLASIVISFIIAYFIVAFLTKPLREIAKEAHEIAIGKKESGVESRPHDEIGVLADALNSMLDALKQKRLEIEDYAKTLETRVKQRTAEFIASEERYRTLVENAPMIVYRVLRDGTTEFVNSKLTENTGYAVKDALNDRRFWRDKMSGMNRNEYNTINRKCFIEGQPCRIEGRVMAKDGRLLTFLTYAIPSKGPDGKVKWIDGIMIDITELKRLQDAAIETEGIRTIGEISARMAHELRNPLSAAGGFAYRLKEALKDDPVNRKPAEIIFEEVAKLENFVKLLLSSIEPFELTYSDVDINSLLVSLLEEVDSFSEKKNITLVKDFESDMPKIKADHDRLKEALGNILKHAVISTPDGETVFVYTSWTTDHILITLTHRMDKVTASDMDKFFFPHVEPEMDKSLLDLPQAKIVIQRHGGKIDLIREKNDVLIMKIRFPLPALMDVEAGTSLV
jgi:PAS domain S-box-containing protein